MAIQNAVVMMVRHAAMSKKANCRVHGLEIGFIKARIPLRCGEADKSAVGAMNRPLRVEEVYILYPK